MQAHTHRDMRHTYIIRAYTCTHTRAHMPTNIRSHAPSQHKCIRAHAVAQAEAQMHTLHHTLQPRARTIQVTHPLALDLQDNLNALARRHDGLETTHTAAINLLKYHDQETYSKALNCQQTLPHSEPTRSAAHHCREFDSARTLTHRREATAPS